MDQWVHHLHSQHIDNGIRKVNLTLIDIVRVHEKEFSDRAKNAGQRARLQRRVKNAATNDDSDGSGNSNGFGGWDGSGGFDLVLL
ncbi:Uncharacterized protein TCM_014904 [Theobroma cacao]|uniref:Uncharacterized protein n=1 Tax=Theobroma cacao TaxID=3641 RepID=A0A061G0W4_THECC|nr:Uncharacterized protein TCM_014904 [Theobroma cacao]